MMKTITQNFILAPVKKMYNDNRQLYIQIFDCKEKAFSQFFFNLTLFKPKGTDRYLQPLIFLSQKRGWLSILISTMSFSKDKHLSQYTKSPAAS